MGKMLRIFSLGGNEISPVGMIDKKTGKTINPDLPKQWERSAKTCRLIAEIIEAAPEHDYIVTHGNGPQVGNILFRAEFARGVLHPVPLDVCGADSQGAIGYMLGQLNNYLRLKAINRLAVESVNQVVVDQADSGFQNPTKFIGGGFSKEEANKRAAEEGWQVKFYKKSEDGTEIWRRVVPSPRPLDIVEIEVIEAKLRAGIIPIAVGGGGIPVVKVEPKIKSGKQIYRGRFGIEFARQDDGKRVPIYAGVEAVIDKDLSTALLGKLLMDRARTRGEKIESEFFIFTNVDGVKLNFQTPEQEDVRHLTIERAQQLLDANTFPKGSMGPKVESAINFIKAGGTRVYITSVDVFEQTLKGEAGTLITL